MRLKDYLVVHQKSVMDPVATQLGRLEHNLRRQVGELVGHANMKPQIAAATVKLVELRDAGSVIGLDRLFWERLAVDGPRPVVLRAQPRFLRRWVEPQYPPVAAALVEYTVRFSEAIAVPLLEKLCQYERSDAFANEAFDLDSISIDPTWGPAAFIEILRTRLKARGNPVAFFESGE